MEHGAKTDELDPDNLNLDNNLDPSDRLWQRNRFAAGPLVFGIIGIVASPLLLGLALGALGMRAGIDLWRNGTRRMVVAVGIALSFFAVVTSVIAALLWGSVLATVLLGRDAMREAERWRGRTVEPRQIETLAASGATTMSLAVPDGAERLVLIFVSTQTAPSAEALVLLGELMPLYPSCRFLVCDPLADAAAVRIFAMLGGVDAPALGDSTVLPPPLDAVAAFPTIVVIDRAGRIESALIGARTRAELDKIFSGAAALQPPEH